MHKIPGKRILPVLALVLLFIGIEYYIFSSRPGDGNIIIGGFKGNVVGIQNDTITLNGIFSGVESLPDNLKPRRDFSFQAGGSTNIKKVDVVWPTWGELAARGTSGTFNIKDLPRSEVEGSLDDLSKLFLSSASTKQTIYMEVHFTNTRYGTRNPTASSITYQIMGIPAPAPSPEDL